MIPDPKTNRLLALTVGTSRIGFKVNKDVPAGYTLHVGLHTGHDIGMAFRKRALQVVFTCKQDRCLGRRSRNKLGPFKNSHFPSPKIGGIQGKHEHEIPAKAHSIL